MTVTVTPLDRPGLAWAQGIVAEHHYLRSSVLGRACPEAWSVDTEKLDYCGCLIVGRPQATRCLGWYGSLEDLAAGRVEASRWQVLSLARVWLSPDVQRGGDYHDPEHLPGFTDRRGVWHSTLASTALRQLARRVGFEYLLARPPVFLEQPYEVRWLLSYCDTSKHRGTIYAAAGWELYRTNENGIQTWRTPLPPLTAEQHAAVAEASAACPRARRFRAERERERAQLGLGLVA